MAGSSPVRVALSLAVLAALTLLLAPWFGAPAAAADRAFKLRSPAIAPNGTLANEQVYNGFGCTGKNISPPLKWSGAPRGTRSFALTVYDPDAPTGSGWWHWVIYDIPATVTELAPGAGSAGGALPAGAVQGRTDFGAPGYGGPCPPSGDKPHRYIFTIYALKTDRIDVPADGSAAMAGFMIRANQLASASFTALYAR